MHILTYILYFFRCNIYIMSFIGDAYAKFTGATPTEAPPTGATPTEAPPTEAPPREGKKFLGIFGGSRRRRRRCTKKHRHSSACKKLKARKSKGRKRR
jgi:hypothetical protein